MMMIFVFFDRRKRQPLANIDQRSTKKCPDPNRLSLFKMAHATRTFWTQNDALEFIAERQKKSDSLFAVIISLINNEFLDRIFFQNEILYLFTFQSQPDGRRRYQVADIDIFIHEY